VFEFALLGLVARVPESLFPGLVAFADFLIPELLFPDLFTAGLDCVAGLTLSAPPLCPPPPPRRCAILLIEIKKNDPTKHISTVFLRVLFMFFIFSVLRVLKL